MIRAKVKLESRTYCTGRARRYSDRFMDAFLREQLMGEKREHCLYTLNRGVLKGREKQGLHFNRNQAGSKLMALQEFKSRPYFPNEGKPLSASAKARVGAARAVL